MIGPALVGLTRALVGARAQWQSPPPEGRQCVFFANHTSHLDTVAIWSALPPAWRRRTRPVAAADYWAGGGWRSWVAEKGLNAVYIERQRTEATTNPLAPLEAALEQGDSLILFPEGTRGQDRLPAPFKAGLFHLAQRFPTVAFVPTYLDTLHRCLPKGCVLPLPLQCTVQFGAPLASRVNEPKDDFLARAHAAVVALAGEERWG